MTTDFYSQWTSGLAQSPSYSFMGIQPSFSFSISINTSHLTFGNLGRFRRSPAWRAGNLNVKIDPARSHNGNSS